MKAETVLPEVTLLYDAREARPENAVGVGNFWYEPEVWSLPLSPASKVLYAGLCSYLGHGQINRKDLCGTLIRHGLLVSADEAVSSSGLSGYKVRSVKEFES
jgi:hypothetical protein